MICPKCEYEYIEGIDTCPDCNTELIPVEEFEGNLLNPKDWIIVYTCSEKYKADMLKSNLEGGGIESIILSQADTSYVVTSGDLAVIKLLVKKTDAVAAAEIIEDINSSSSENENQ
ncbi:MAG: DUF2007 domain-containing protein [Ignavibacteria bacterium]|jgi:hypothetical protein